MVWKAIAWNFYEFHNTFTKPSILNQPLFFMFRKVFILYVTILTLFFFFYNQVCMVCHILYTTFIYLIHIKVMFLQKHFILDVFDMFLNFPLLFHIKNVYVRCLAGSEYASRTEYRVCWRLLVVVAKKTL